jgi:dTDP-4-dehydrorhamnose reductase
MGLKILITGGRGMLATDFARVAADQGFEVVSLGRQELDVTKADQVAKALEGLTPQYVFHTVGLLVDPCERDPAEGYRVHAWATGCLARHCQRIGATLVNISTCGMFGDERRYYSEYDPVLLKTQYARSKYLAEEAAALHCERTFNIRPGWMFGGTPEHKKNFVFQRYLEAKQKPVLRSAGDKFGSPTFTEDISRRILDLIRSEEYGVYHITNQGGSSRYDYVKRILEAFGSPSKVEMVDSSAFARLAPVPDCEMLDNLNARFLGLPPLPPWEEAVDRYVRKLQAEFGL